MFSRHVTKDISAYCHGELSNEESKRFAEHIISCAKCRTRFEEVKLGVKLAEQLPQLAAPDHLWRELEPLLDREHVELRPARVSAWQLKAAAAVLVLLSAWGVWLIYSNCRVAILTVDGKLVWRATRRAAAPRTS